jgi:hypothetical protein
VEKYPAMWINKPEETGGAAGSKGLPAAGRTGIKKPCFSRKARLFYVAVGAYLA